MTQSASCRKRCDVHVIVNPDYREYHDQCLRSLLEEPIHLHQIPFTKGNIGVGRYNGFNSGHAEFVSFVDDDDYVIPGIFEKCYRALDENPDAIGVVTREQRLIDGVLQAPDEIHLDAHWVSYFKFMHHLLMFRRDRILPFVELIKDCNTGEIAYLLIEVLSAGHKFCLVDEVGYVWRIHEDSACNTLKMEGWHRNRGQMLHDEAAVEANERSGNRLQ